MGKMTPITGQIACEFDDNEAFKVFLDRKPRYFAVAEMPNGARIEGEMTRIDVTRTLGGATTGEFGFKADRFAVDRSAIPDGTDLDALRACLAVWDIELVVTE